MSHDHGKKKRMDIPEDKIGNGILNNISRIVGVASGKGGVGKSTVTALTALALKRKGYSVGILDADITGPSIPGLFGLTAFPEKMELGILPVKSKENIIVMSINLLLENKEDPVLWRGPLLGGMIQQFWNEVIWANLDFLLIDMPPGTGDVPMTVYQSIPVDEVVMVTGPQEITNLIVKKSVVMAEKMNIEITGLVENMSYISCPSCQEKIKPFGESYAPKMAEEKGLEILSSLGIDSELIALANEGRIEEYTGNNMDQLAPLIERLEENFEK